MKSIILPVAIAAMALIGACGDARHEPVTAKALPIPIEAPKPTPEAWKAAVDGAYLSEVRKSADSDEGVTEFMACFGPGEGKEKCGSGRIFGKRDAFRKLRVYWSGTFGASSMYGTKLGSYVSLRDNQQPTVVLVSQVFMKNGLLRMNQVSVMVDGEVTLDQSFIGQDVKREQFPGGVNERIDFLASPSQIEALRKIAPSSKVAIRITGDKGYQTLEKQDVADFKSEVVRLLTVFDVLQKAVEGKTISEPST